MKGQRTSAQQLQGGVLYGRVQAFTTVGCKAQGRGEGLIQAITSGLMGQDKGLKPCQVQPLWNALSCLVPQTLCMSGLPEHSSQPSPPPRTTHLTCR
jgi:hypothetical protein